MSDTEPVEILDDDECWRLLGAQELGRLVTHVGRVIDIFPVNFVVDERTIVLRTAEGSKLFELTVNDEVVFEVDDRDDEHAWSVIVRGHAHRLDTSAEVAAADQLALHPWIPTLKYVYVRILTESITGRRFRRDPEPDRYGIPPN